MRDDVTATEGWVQLLEEMDAMAEELEADGWETLTIPAGDTGAVLAEEPFTDRHGYVYVVPGDVGETFETMFVPDGFSQTDIYQRATPKHLFLLTVFLDQPTGSAILLAGVHDRETVQRCRGVASETGVMYSHLFTVDRTHLGSFEHDDPAPFFPVDGSEGNK